MRKYFILPLIVLTFLLSGCERVAEPNDLLYAVAVGVDKGDESGYKFTIQYAKVFEINSGAESGESGGEIVENITVDAPSLYSAVDIANHLVSKRFTLSHLRLAVFSQETAREGIGDFVEVMSRSRDIRPDVYIAVAENSSEDYLKSVKPAGEVNPSKYYQLMYENVYSEYIPKTTSEDLYKSIAGGGRDVAAAIAGEPAEKNEGEIIDTGYEYGIMKMSAEKTSDSGVMGMGIFSKDKLVLMCTSDEVKLYNILMNKFEYGYITFYNNKKPSVPITLRVEKNRDVDINTVLENDRIKADLKIYMEAEFSGLPQDYHQEKYIEEYEDEIEKYIENSMREFLEKVYSQKSDILNIQGRAKRKFLTYSKYEEYNAESKTVEFDIDVNMRIRRAGMTVRE